VHSGPRAALVTSLRSDPFYAAISAGFADDEAARAAVLTRYFDYAIAEGERIGRVATTPDGCSGVAVWTLPLEPAARASESSAKSRFLSATLSPLGLRNYERIIGYMAPRAARLVSPSAWYLSIVGVAPSAQGRGCGAALVRMTLREADEATAECYLETFEARNLSFYARLGFAAAGSYAEPTTGATYHVLRRPPCDGRPGP